MRGSKKPCSAIPTAKNSNCHDHKPGLNSSFREGITVSGEEMAGGFYLAARFFASLEQNSELLERYRGYPELHEHLFKCPESIVDLVDEE